MANRTQIIIGALHILTMGLSLAMVPVVLFPILRKFNVVLTLGFDLMDASLSGGTFILNFPIFLQEMVMAVWLIVKGFNPSIVASPSARLAIHEV